MQGTTSILKSALKHGSTLKRLILTSSAVATIELTTVPRFFTESDWNDAAVEAVKTKGSAAGPFLVYCASKTLAEKSAWDFVAAHDSEISWDLAVINPTLIIGVRLFFPSFSAAAADVTTHIYPDSLRSGLRRQLMTSIPLSAESMTP